MNKKQQKRADKKQIHLVIPEKKPSTTPAVAPVQPLTKPTAPEPVKSEQPRQGNAKTSGKDGLTIQAAQIADELGETKKFPRNQIKHVLWALGRQQTLDLVKRAKAIHAGEGMVIPSGTRKRTLGGCFFYLCYSIGKPLDGRKLTRPEWKPRTPPSKQEPETAEQVFRQETEARFLGEGEEGKEGGVASYWQQPPSEQGKLREQAYPEAPSCTRVVEE